jgi:hypothetical protein
MDRTIRVRLKEEQFRKYKVFCAINDISMTDQTNKIVREFIEKQNNLVKIISLDNIVQNKDKS